MQGGGSVAVSASGRAHSLRRREACGNQTEANPGQWPRSAPTLRARSRPRLRPLARRFFLRSGCDSESESCGRSVCRIPSKPLADSVNIAWNRPNVGRHRANFGRARPDFYRTRPKLALVGFRIEFVPNWLSPPHIWPNLGQSQHRTSGEFGPNSTELIWCQSNSLQIGSTSVELWPNLARSRPKDVSDFDRLRVAQGVRRGLDAVLS